MHQKIDIEPEHFFIIEAILKKYLPPHTTVWVFGSRAKGNARKFSDIDLIIDASEKNISDFMTNIKFDLEESDLPYKVDVIDWNKTSKNFKNIISTDRLLFYKT